MHGAIPPLLQHVFTARCLVKHKILVYLGFQASQSQFVCSQTQPSADTKRCYVTS